MEPPQEPTRVFQLPAAQSGPPRPSVAVAAVVPAVVHLPSAAGGKQKAPSSHHQRYLVPQSLPWPPPSSPPVAVQRRGQRAPRRRRWRRKVGPLLHPLRPSMSRSIPSSPPAPATCSMKRWRATMLIQHIANCWRRTRWT